MRKFPNYSERVRVDLLIETLFVRVKGFKSTLESIL